MMRAQTLARQKPCETCGTLFVPRPRQLRLGQGRYCSHRCAASVHLITPENLAKAQEGRRQALAAGAIRLPRGPANKQWMGGKKAYKERRRDSGREAEALREYRKRNPEKVREWAINRKSGKLDRLPRGTIPRIGALQNWRCAICRTSIKSAYEIDHIEPIARGGKHEPRNLQLLCKPCNGRKSAKDPIRHMQELGRLL